MKTIFKSPVGFFSADTSKSVKQIPEGKLWIHTVQFETYELDADSEEGKNIQFTIAAAIPAELRKEGQIENANLFQRLLKQIAQHWEQNKSC